MRRKLSPLDVDHCIALNMNGMNLVEIERAFRVGANVISKWMCQSGYTPVHHHRTAHNAKDVDVQRLVAEYAAGDSVLTLSKRHGIRRPTVAAHLKRQGVELRDSSQANVLRMARLSPEDRKALAKNAHDAKRGKANTRAARINAAQTRQKTKSIVFGHGERALLDALCEKGFSCVPQAAFDVYNIDIMVGNTVAVEITCGSACNFKSERNLRKLEKLVKANFAVLCISIQSERALAANMEQVVADIDRISRNPTARGQMRVVRCRFENSIRFRGNDGRIASIPTPEKAVYAAQ